MKKRHNFDPNSLDKEGEDTEYAKEEHAMTSGPQAESQEGQTTQAK
jgi:hypothetical protein